MLRYLIIREVHRERSCRGPVDERAGRAGGRREQGDRRGHGRGVWRRRGGRGGPGPRQHRPEGRDTTALSAVADGIQARGGRALAVGADVTDVASMRDVVDQAVSVFGRLDAAFNNASAGPLPSPLADIDPDEFDLGIATNIRGTFLGMKFQIPAMLASGGGGARASA